MRANECGPGRTLEMEGSSSRHLVYTTTSYSAGRANFLGEGLRPLYCDTTVFPKSANGSAAFGTGLRRKRATTETRIDFPVGTTPQPPVNGRSCVTQWVHHVLTAAPKAAHIFP